MDNSLEFTKHAVRRCQQRGIPPFIVELILDHGRIRRRHGADCYFLDKKATKEIKRTLGSQIYARISDQLNVYVVAEEEIVTVGHRTKRMKFQN